MDESEDKMCSGTPIKTDSTVAVKVKPKKRSLVERELETNLTPQAISPVTIADGANTSRYGRARRLKTETEISDSCKIMFDVLKSTPTDKSPVKVQSPVYKMHASNSPIRTETPKKTPVEAFLENQIENIYQENISLSRFTAEELVNNSPCKNNQKIYIQKDLIQSREPDETLILIKNMFSPVKSGHKSKSTHLTNILERSSDKFNLTSQDSSQNSFIDNSSVVKMLDFDSKKKKKESKVLSKSDLFELEAKCMYQVGDLAWSRMGTYPFWPCIVTRDPGTDIFVKKKLFGRIEREIIHVTFFGDNGRRGWIVDNMLRKFMGLAEFESTRDKFTTEDKKKDPRFYAAFFISDKKLASWHTSVEEAETLLKEPKRLRIDLLNDMLEKSRSFKITDKILKSEKVTRTDSDVSLSESLYDTLFSEDDGKTDDSERSKNKSKNKSLDVSEVVTACLDNMAAKTGITKIQRQSHMDRWLQKAKSKTPEKTQVKILIPKKGIDNKVSSTKKKLHRNTIMHYSLRKSPYESQNLLAHQNEHDYSKFVSDDDNSSVKTNVSDGVIENKYEFVPLDESGAGIGVISKVESLADNKEKSRLDKTLKNESVKNITSSEVAKENVIEHGVAAYNKIDVQNIEADQSNNSIVQEMEVDINNENEQIWDHAISNKNENILSYTSYNQEDNTFGSNTSLDHSELANDSENIGIINKIATEIDNCNDDVTNNSGEKDNFSSILKNNNSVIASDIFNLTKTNDHDTINCNDAGIEESNSSSSTDIINETKRAQENKSDNLHLDLNLFSQSKCDEVSLNIEILSSNQTENAFLHSVKLPHEDNKKKDVNKLSEETNNSIYNNYNSQPDKNANTDINEHDDILNQTGNFKLKIASDSLIISDNVDIKLQQYKSIGALKEKSADNCINLPQECNTTKKTKNINVQKTNHIADLKVDSTINEESRPNNQKDINCIEKLKRNTDEHFSVNTLDEKSDNHCINLQEESRTNENINNIVITRNGACNLNIDNTRNTLNSSNMSVNVKEISQECQNITKKNELVNFGLSDLVITAKEDGKQKHSNCTEALKKNMDEYQNINGFHETDIKSHDTINNSMDNIYVDSEVSEISKSKDKNELHNKKQAKELDDPEFLKYFKLRQDIFMEEYPELSDDEIITYLYQTWFYEVSKKSEIQKADCIEQETLVKGMNKPVSKKSTRRVKRKDKTDSDCESIKSESSHASIESYFDSKSSVALVKRDQSLVRLLKSISPSPSKEISDTIKENDVNISESNKTSDSKNTKIEITANTFVSFNHSEIEMKTEVACSSLKSNNENIAKINLPTKKSNIISISKSGVQETKNIVSEISNENKELDTETASIGSEAIDVPLIYRKSRFIAKENSLQESVNLDASKEETESNNESFNSEDSEPVTTKTKQKNKQERKLSYADDPEFNKYCELRQDILIEENPQLSEEEIKSYLYKTWIYEENSKSELKKVDEVTVKGLEEKIVPPKKVKKRVQVPREITDYFQISPKTRRKSIKPFYNEEYYSDIEDEIESFEIRPEKNDKLKEAVLKTTDRGNEATTIDNTYEEDEEEEIDEAEIYFSTLTKPKPNIFKGLLREKVCDICEKTGNLVKCKSCHGMYHINCVQSETKVVEISTPHRGRRKKKKINRKPKNPEDSEGNSDDKQDISEDNNISVEEIEAQSFTVDAEILENQLTEKMKVLLENAEPVNYDSYSSDNEVDWNDAIAGKCEIVNVKVKRKSFDDYPDFKCKSCIKHDTPVCFVCRSAVSKKESKIRQRCNVQHCNKYYHVECLDHWPQTQFNSCEPSKNSRKVNEHFEALSCPRHVCHTCVSDDPRGCKTRFSGDKLARCVRCPATYHTFTKCVPAGSQILTASHIICPRHYEHRPGKVPCHVNTGWCFICALGGSLICCEYCPTSFHAECLNIDPPEGGYMCEDCETGRLPLYEEMVWVKLGHYRWWPGLILHPSEIPSNIMAVKHSQGEFVVRFFGQYDYYWVNRGRVFPFQEGDSGRVSSQKSKIDAAFTMAMDHAQRACEILKSAMPNEEESMDIASSLLPPHYVRLKVNKPCGSLCGRKLDDPELSLTQCECNPDEEDPCGPYSQCLNRMLLTECGPTCRAGDRCNNRAFEKRLYPKLVPYRTPHRGWGLKTLEDIKAGQFVIEYVGELIDEEEFKRRMRRKHEIRDENFYFLTLDKERMIDAGPKGNLARFMNHCCEPNCETQKWTVLGDVRVGLFALFNIPANSEVTFNYNLESAGIEKKRCLCGAKRCSGYIGAKPKQDESQSKKGKMAPKKIYKKRKVEDSPATNKTKKKQGRPPKPKELSEIEKDLLIIRNATNGLSSDESSRSFSSEGDRLPKALKRKRVDFSTEETMFNLPDSSSSKRQKNGERDD